MKCSECRRDIGYRPKERNAKGQLEPQRFICPNTGNAAEAVEK